MRVLIKDLIQNLFFKINVKSSDTIMKIKDKVKEIEATKQNDLDIKLIYAGNILADDITVEECGFSEQDYVTLVYNPLEKDQVEGSIMQADTENGDSTFKLSDSDSKFDDASRHTFLASIPNGDKLCKIMSENPEELPKPLSKLARNGPSVFEKIISNQHIFIDLLDTPLDTGDAIKDLDTNGHEAIDRLVEKGFEKELAVQAYLACDLNENFATEFLNALKI